jgi:hypothetical protein
MPDEILRETWITVPAAALPVAGAILVAAGLCLILWTDAIVDLALLLLGILAILLGTGFLAAGHLMGRAGFPPVLLFIAGLTSVLVGILAILRPDIATDLVIFLTAGIAILLGAFLLFIGGLLSLPGWGRRAFLWGGLALLVGGIALALFPGPVGRGLLAAGGAVLLAAGCGALLISLAGRRPRVSRL